MAPLRVVWQHQLQMLTSITIKDFRTFKDVTIPLKPITVFIGPNNSGKTNAIRAIQLLTSAVGTRPDRSGFIRHAEGAPFELTASGQFGPFLLTLTLSEPTQTEFQGTASIELGGAQKWAATYSGRKNEAHSPKGATFHSNNPAEFLRSSLERIVQDLPAARPALDFFQGVRTASLSVPVLREPATISSDPVLGERGENFGAVLDWISGKRPALFRSINEELVRVLKVDGCTTLVTQDGLKVPAIIEGDRSFGADQISDGVLLYLGLTTVARLVGSGSLLVVEEPENGIHPRRLKDLLEQIRAISRSGTQIILTTHSPILLDEFSEQPESIVVFDRDSSGTHVSQPNPEQLKQVLSGDFGLGSLWFSGAIGGVPA